MRPHRVRLTHSLVEHYGLPSSLAVHRPVPRSELQLEEFHADDYVRFLKHVTPDNQDDWLVQMRRFNLGPVGEADCPVFDSMFEYCSVRRGVGGVGGETEGRKGGRAYAAAMKKNGLTTPPRFPPFFP
jgi:histone deacetylase 1/2